jgi:hypothetical protein
MPIKKEKPTFKNKKDLLTGSLHKRKNLQNFVLMLLEVKMMMMKVLGLKSNDESK